MKKIPLLIAVFFTICICKAQIDCGVSLSYSKEKTVGFDLFLIKEKNRFHIGFGYQFDNLLMKKIMTERKPNYGLTKIEDGEYLWLINFGYSKVLTNKLSLNPELTYGKLTQFTNYKDNRFSDGGYSLIEGSKSKIGFGINLGYFMGNKFEPFIGYNTIKKFNGGLRYTFI